MGIRKQRLSLTRRVIRSYIYSLPIWTER